MAAGNLQGRGRRKERQQRTLNHLSLSDSVPVVIELGQNTVLGPVGIARGPSALLLLTRTLTGPSRTE